VQVGLSHYELNASYGLRDAMQLTLRLPYDVKAMRVAYTTLDGAPFTPPYGDIHHRSETLRGIGDPSLLLDVQRGPTIFTAGFSLPFGRIERDPIALGSRGLTHEHMQFGSGTVQPIVGVQWSGSRWSASAEGRLALYENREGFRAPHSLVWAVGPTLPAGRVSIAAALNGQYQSRAYWSGAPDENSGFHNGGLRVQIAVPWRGAILAPFVNRELWSRSLDNEESFRGGWTWGIRVAR
jgi:hypothetical protein